MVDINKRSMDLAIKNSELNNVKVNVFESDGFKNITKKYDYIVTNPPIRVGKNKLYELLFEAKKHLKDNGIMYLVVNKDQGAKSILKDLNNKYEANVINKNKGFYIIEAKNSKKL
jgi:16S rRNA (guanine1207-N2)-methyltransferase